MAFDVCGDGPLLMLTAPTAEHLVAQGAYVTLSDINEQAGREAAERLGPQANFVRADVTDSTQMEEVFAAAEAQGPPPCRGALCRPRWSGAGRGEGR